MSEEATDEPSAVVQRTDQDEAMRTIARGLLRLRESDLGSQPDPATATRLIAQAMRPACAQLECSPRYVHTGTPIERAGTIQRFAVLWQHASMASDP